MVVLFAVAVVAHGLLHLLGFAKAFGLAELPQLTRPISQFAGMLWLLAALLFLAAAVSLFLWPRGWWVIGAIAIVISMIVILPSWIDARFGALANLVILVGVIFGFLAYGPASLRAAYDRDTDRGLAHGVSTEAIAEADLASLPEPVQRYLRVTGAVGRPRVHNFRARMHGRIRNGRDAGWIPLAAEQYNFVDSPARLFYLTGSMFAIPVQGYHRYGDGTATMTIKAAALVPVVAASGMEMDQGETVTMFNDMCVMAPATLIGPGIVWDAVDQKMARATFTNAGHTIRAELSFNERGELTNFRSDDRYQTSADGNSVTRLPWSTPLDGYRSFDSVRLAGSGEARWRDADGEFTYVELTFDDIEYNVTSRSGDF
jgi:hypothetical protein